MSRCFTQDRVAGAAVIKSRVTKPSIANARRGIKLVELVVVIGVIGFLVLMVMPSVNRSALGPHHEANCGSSMKQVARAMASHEADFRVYPVGADPLTGHTGLTHLLQFLGNQNLFNAFEEIGFDKVITDKAFDDLTAADIEIYCCPSDPASDSGTYVQDGKKYARSNFVMCFGGGATWDSGGNTRTKGIWRVGARSSSSYAVDGDGLSTTAAISEVAADPANGIAGLWAVAAGGASGYTHFAPPMTGVWPGSKDGQIPNFGTPEALENEGGRASSHHPGFVNVAFVDTHVERIGNDVDPNVWRAMGTAQGGEIIMDDSEGN